MDWRPPTFEMYLAPLFQRHTCSAVLYTVESLVQDMDKKLLLWNFEFWHTTWKTQLIGTYRIHSTYLPRSTSHPALIRDLCNLPFQETGSDLSYKKWLSLRSPSQQSEALTPGSDRQDQRSGNEGWGYCAGRGKPKQIPRLIFLTEEDTRCRGQFSKRRRELLESKDIPKAYDGNGGRPSSFGEGRSAQVLRCTSSISAGKLLLWVLRWWCHKCILFASLITMCTRRWMHNNTRT